MTHNPTPAEVEAAYMRVHDVMEFADGQPPRAAIATLLAAVARDTLGWREVEAHETNGLHMQGTVRVHINRDDALAGNRYWIKDAPT